MWLKFVIFIVSLREMFNLMIFIIYRSYLLVFEFLDVGELIYLEK